MPCFIAKSFAPFPLKKTWLLLIITSVANSMGLRTLRTPATAPAAKPLPSMMAASISCTPFFVNTEPLPALNNKLSSNVTQAAFTAFTDVPPSSKTA